MTTTFRFPNVVYTTFKNYSETRRESIEQKIRNSARIKGWQIVPIGGGYVMPYNLAKSFVRNLHLHCSRFFTLGEAMEMRAKGLISEADFDEACSC